eukprot:c25112_g2_i1 orf=517-1443(-)
MVEKGKLGTLEFPMKFEVMNKGLAVLAPLPLQLTPMISASSGDIAAASSVNGIRREDRLPQWGYQETKDFIAVRAELEMNFTQTKRNKLLWEVISSKMRERGYRRSADQCKCKWKNLVSKYKVLETSEQDNGRQCPFFEELQAIFCDRNKNVDRLLLETETWIRPKKKVRLGEKSSDEYSDEDEDEDEETGGEQLLKRKKRKAEKEKQKLTADRSRANSMQEVLEDFFQQQQRMEMLWREVFERREQEHKLRQQEWRESMEKLEKERIFREQVWREREERRRAREEARAEKRDALFTTLLTRLAREEL